jgi:hypothetical protein
MIFLSIRFFTRSIFIFNIYMGVTIILPLVLYGCETCSLTLKEEHRLRVFENRILRYLDQG